MGGTAGRAKGGTDTRASRREVALARRGPWWAGTFGAMASPCEVLVDGGSRREARRLTTAAADEAWRVERAFSRYRDDNVVHRINASRGRPLDVDAETARLLDFAARCHALSEGLFDITSGVLRRAWRFDGTGRVPTAAEVGRLLRYVGWHRVTWERPRLTLPDGMQIDFGGIGKEYAVDRAVALLRERTARPVLVNFGGDLHASAPPESAAAWRVGVESARVPASDGPRSGEPQPRGPRSCAAWPDEASPSEARSRGPAHASATLALQRGALATSGDARRHLVKEGVRYGHVLSPLTGWPVPDAPRSVTVAGESCTQAGLLATLALLHGAGAEALLDAQSVPYWCQRDGQGP